MALGWRAFFISALFSGGLGDEILWLSHPQPLQNYTASFTGPSRCPIGEILRPTSLEYPSDFIFPAGTIFLTALIRCDSPSWITGISPEIQEKSSIELGTPLLLLANGVLRILAKGEPRNVKQVRYHGAVNASIVPGLVAKA